MGETISDKTDFFLKVKGPELMKEKFPGISIEMPSDDLSQKIIYDYIYNGWPYDKIIESLVEIKQPGVRIPKSYSQMEKKYGDIQIEHLFHYYLKFLILK